MTSAVPDKRSQPQWTVSGIVECPVDEVWQALIDANPNLTPADKASVLAKGGSSLYLTTIGKPGEGKLTIEIDRSQHHIAVQGEWWYRGVHTVKPHPRGSLVRYEVYNVAPGLGWWGAQLVQGPQHAREMPQALSDLLYTISKRLDCKSALIG